MSQSTTENVIEQVFPYLIVRDAPRAIEFYQRVFGAVETFRLAEPGGRIGHAELKIGPAVVMIADEHPEHGIQSPLAFGGTGVRMHLHVTNVDDLMDKAVDAGAKVIMGPTNQFYGERTAKFLDPFGHEWYLGQHIEDVSVEEMQQRYNDLCSKAN